jgi:DNA-binding transcriptional regulator YhcF (GntR family)
MSRWFRFYDDAINDPKILKLSDKLHRVWVGILCVASKNGGKLPALDDMALMIRMKPEKLNDALKDLAKAGLIDTDGVISSPHNWDKRQFKSDVSSERVKRFRQRYRNVSETPPDTEQIQITEQKKDAAATASPDTESKQVYDLAKTIIGEKSGGFVKKLIEAKDGSLPLTMAALHSARAMSNPREYLGAIIRGRGSTPDKSAGRAF